MSGTPRPRIDVVDKVALWKTAFDAIAPEIQTPGMVELLAAMQTTEAMRDMPLFIQLARVISANQRAAATVAALLVQSGIKPTAVDYGDDA